MDACRFKAETVPVEILGKKGPTLVEKDEGPRKETSLEALAALKPTFEKDGTVTPGNAPGLNDGASGNKDLRLRSDRGERSVRRAGARRRPRARLGLGPGERERGGDRPRAPDRRLRRAYPHDTPVRFEEPEANDRPRHPVSRGWQRRGPQPGDALMQAQTAVASVPSLTGRRALAVLAGVALVAIAAQIAIPLPGTPVPMTLQPLAVLLVGGMLGPRLGAGALL